MGDPVVRSGIADEWGRAIERCTFDRARLIRHNRILAKNGIAPDGEFQHRAQQPALLGERDIVTQSSGLRSLIFRRHSAGPEGCDSALRRYQLWLPRYPSSRFTMRFSGWVIDSLMQYSSPNAGGTCYTHSSSIQVLEECRSNLPSSPPYTPKRYPAERLRLRSSSSIRPRSIQHRPAAVTRGRYREHETIRHPTAV